MREAATLADQFLINFAKFQHWKSIIIGQSVHQPQ
jgi:hypothetical protein